MMPITDSAIDLSRDSASTRPCPVLPRGILRTQGTTTRLFRSGRGFGSKACKNGHHQRSTTDHDYLPLQRHRMLHRETLRLRTYCTSAAISRGHRNEESLVIESASLLETAGRLARMAPGVLRCIARMHNKFYRLPCLSLIHPSGSGSRPAVGPKVSHGVDKADPSAASAMADFVLSHKLLTP